MPVKHNLLLSLAVLITSAMGTAAGAQNVTVTVGAMIGEATVGTDSDDGKESTLIVPTGNTSRKDPRTGQTELESSVAPNTVNEVVHAIVSSAPDAATRQATDKGCSQGQNALRRTARPDEAAAAALAKQLQALSSGDLMMVIAVLINNANHLCIDATAIADTIALIATVRPEEAGNVVFVAALLDPGNSDDYTGVARNKAPGEVVAIDRANDDADKLNEDFNAPIPTRQNSPVPPQDSPKPPIEHDIPPGGTIGPPPSPE